jgi:hypothetical protein
MKSKGRAKCAKGGVVSEILSPLAGAGPPVPGRAARLCRKAAIFGQMLKLP